MSEVQCPGILCPRACKNSGRLKQVWAAWRMQGVGRALMTHALATAWQADAFKVMLMTGTRRGATGFYTAAGFSPEDKTAMVIRRP